MGQYQAIPNYPPPNMQRRHTSNRQSIPSNRRVSNNPRRESRDQGPQASAIPGPQLPIPMSLPLVPDPAVIVGASSVPLPDQRLTMEYLSQLPPTEQAQLIGEKLYALIAMSQPVSAGKITGMLLERYTSPLEMLVFLEHPEALNEKINEAVGVLQAHAAGETDPNEAQEA